MSDFYRHPAAIVDSDQIGSGTRVWAFAHVLKGALVGRDCNLGNHVFVEGGAVVGNAVTVKNNVCIWDGITLEDEVFVGPNVAFTNDRYPRSPRMAAVKERYATPEGWLQRTVVRRGASIGANATLVPGIELGEFCSIAAGAIVTRNVGPYELVAGAPARQIGHVCRCGQRITAPLPGTLCPSCAIT